MAYQTSSNVNFIQCFLWIPSEVNSHEQIIVLKIQNSLYCLQKQGIYFIGYKWSMVGVYVCIVWPRESQGEDEPKPSSPLKCWLGLWAGIFAVAWYLCSGRGSRLVNWLQRCVWALSGCGKLHLSTAPAAGIIKLAMLRCAPASSASGYCLCWVYFLPFRCC